MLQPNDDLKTGTKSSSRGITSYPDLRRYAVTPIPVTRAAPAATPLYAAAHASRLDKPTAMAPPEEEATAFLRLVVPE